MVAALIKLKTQFGRWITYGDRQFYSTQLAQELGPIAEECGNLDSTPAASLLA